MMLENSIAVYSTTEGKGTSTVTPQDSSDAAVFFPWLEPDEENPKLLSKKTLSRFPILGAVGLIGSAVTVLFSLLVLSLFNGHKVITKDYHHILPKPAAWLSIILSLNTALVHLAVSQGLAVTWWFRASKPQTTVGDLHNVWATGTSLVDAVAEWRAFNYIALATVMVATLPANGIFLQNAVSTVEIHKKNDNRNTSYEMVSKLPYGVSAELNGDGTIGSYNSEWQSSLSSIIGHVDTFYTASENSSSCGADCFADLTGIGFNAVCNPIAANYSLPRNYENITINSTVFSTEIFWDVNNPYIIDLWCYWKNDSACSGSAEYHHCKLTLGTVTYPVQVHRNVDEENQHIVHNEWYLNDTQMLDGNSQFKNDSNFNAFRDPPRELDVDADVQATTTYGGIVHALAAYYNSKIMLKFIAQNTTVVLIDGFDANRIPIEYTYNGPNATAEWCSIKFAHFDLSATPIDYTLNQIRSALFRASVWAGDYKNHFPQADIWDLYGEATAPDPQVVTETRVIARYNIYRVVWYWYGAHVAVTLLVIVFILPTFYGFWTLARKTTLSPFETARAFHAPILYDQATYLTTPELLMTVGKKKLHTDLAAVPVKTSGEKSS